MPEPVIVSAPRDIDRIRRLFPSFCQFVDDALFHPKWGYYSTGRIRFGEGGHYDTFPIALSPLFGRMVAEYAFRLWRRFDRPAHFEICELGAGNGKLCLDALVSLETRRLGRRGGRRNDFGKFSRALRYRIVERSPALLARQRETLGALADRVTWTRADLSRRTARDTPFGRHGLVFGNEVLDCLSHHKVVPNPNGEPRVAFVVPELRRLTAHMRRVHGLKPRQAAIRHADLATACADPRLRAGLRFREALLPVSAVPGLQPFLRRYYPEFFRPGPHRPPYFACPGIETLIRNTARLYEVMQAVWIDYGDTRDFHLNTPANKRLLAGTPRSGASVYDRPGLEDITFMVDFSVVGAAAERSGLRTEAYRAQGELARRSGVRLDAAAARLILRSRMLDWMLSVTGVGSERAWRHSALTWDPERARGGKVVDDVDDSIAEFLGRKPSAFKMIVLERP